jgi:hypothetical protein
MAKGSGNIGRGRRPSDARAEKAEPRFSVCEADLLDLIKRHGLKPPRDQRLCDLIAHTGDRLRNFLENKDEFTPEGRRRRRTEVERLARAFGAAEEALADSTQIVRGELNRLLAPSLGRSLSIHTFEQAGVPVSTEVSIHTLFEREGTRREGPYRALEVEVAEARRLAARKAGHTVLEYHCRYLRERLEGYLKLEKKLKIEFRGNHYRRIVVASLAIGFEDVFGLRPTPTEGSLFVNVCDAVLRLFNLPTDGLTRAIERVLKAMPR